MTLLPHPPCAEATSSNRGGTSEPRPRPSTSHPSVVAPQYCLGGAMHRRSCFCAPRARRAQTSLPITNHDGVRTTRRSHRKLRRSLVHALVRLSTHLSGCPRTCQIQRAIAARETRRGPPPANQQRPIVPSARELSSKDSTTFFVTRIFPYFPRRGTCNNSRLRSTAPPLDAQLRVSR